MPQTHYPAPMYHTARPFGKACRFFAYKASKGPVLFFYTTLFQNTPPHFVATPGGFKCLVILYIGERANRHHFSDPLPVVAGPNQGIPASCHTPRAPGAAWHPTPPPAGPLPPDPVRIPRTAPPLYVLYSLFSPKPPKNPAFLRRKSRIIDIIYYFRLILPKC